MTGIDPWFLDQIQQIVDLEKRIASKALASGGEARGDGRRAAPRRPSGWGFSDVQVARAALGDRPVAWVRRQAQGGRGGVPVYHRVDTCAAIELSHSRTFTAPTSAIAKPIPDRKRS